MAESKVESEALKRGPEALCFRGRRSKVAPVWRFAGGTAIVVVWLSLAPGACSPRSGTLSPTDETGPDYAAVFDTGAVLDVHLTIAPAALAVMDDVNYVHGDFACGDIVLRDVAVRYKGNSSYFLSGQKKSYKVDFNRFVQGQSFHGFKKLNFNNGFGDPSMLREKLGYDIHRDSGNAAGGAGWANVYVNGALQGLYVTVEQVDKTFLKARFGNDTGNLYKTSGAECPLTYRGMDPENYAGLLELKTNEDEADHSGLVHFIWVLDTTEDARFEEEILKVFNVEGFLAWLAVDATLSNLENYAGTANDFYLYENPAPRRFEYIPWDLGEEFGAFRGRPDPWTADEMLTLDIYRPLQKDPLPPDLPGLHGLAPNYLWVVGERGASTLYYQGKWNPVTTGSGQGLNSVWCALWSSIFAVGNNGTVLRFNGVSWSAFPPVTSRHLLDVWGSGPADVFAVGTSGRIIHFDGSTWTPMTYGAGPALHGVWGSGPNDVWTVGGGVIGHYDGSTWSTVTPPAPSPMPLLHDVWGSGPADVWAAGDGGIMLRYNGSAWSVVPSGTGQALQGLWGSGANNVFAVGNAGTILRFNGSTWSAMSSGTAENLTAVWGSSGSDVFASGMAGTIIHFDGAAWTSMDCGIPAAPPPPRPLVTRLLAVPSFRAFYEDRIRTFLAGPFAQAAMDSRIVAQANLIRPSVYADPLKEMTDQEFEDSIVQDIPLTGPSRILGLKPFVAGRTTSVQNQLP